MFRKLKNALYFPIASYFRFFAAIRLKKWKPQIIVVTGSNGKTTLLHMLESQIGPIAKYSHHANSAYGIPFDILGLHRETLQMSEWFSLVLKTPFQIFKALPKEKLYVVESDADRPGEGKFLAELLKPDVVLWVSTARTHSMNFDALVSQRKFATVEEAIAYEYGWFVANALQLVVTDGDSPLIVKQLKRTKVPVKAFQKSQTLKKYTVDKNGTQFTFSDKPYAIPYLLPEEAYISVAMSEVTMQFINMPMDTTFKRFSLPPGRGSIFAGIEDVTIIDSSYNANLGSMAAMLAMLRKFPGNKKWVVVSDMFELGNEEQEEHTKLAHLLESCDLERIFFLGPRVKRYTLPEYKKITKRNAFLEAFENPKHLLDFIEKTIQGNETILFKGSQSAFLEGIIAPLLKNKEDKEKLPRQEIFWQKKRETLGLH